MNGTLIAFIITLLLDLYLFFIGELSSALAINSGAFLIGILIGELVTKVNYYEDDDDYDDVDDYDEEEYEKEDA